MRGVRFTVRRGGRGAGVEWALMCIQLGSYLPGTTEEASLAQGHRVSMGAGEFSPWPREVGNSCDVMLGKGVR